MHPEAISDGLNIMNAYSETKKENEETLSRDNFWSRDRKLMEDILQQYYMTLLKVKDKAQITESGNIVRHTGTKYDV